MGLFGGGSIYQGEKMDGLKHVSEEIRYLKVVVGCIKYESVAVSGTVGRNQ